MRKGVLTVQPGGNNSGDEKLGSVGVLTSICHRELTWLVVLQLKVLIFKLGAVDRLTTTAVSLSEVTTLKHELRNDPMEDRVDITERWVLGDGQLAEVLDRLWNNVAVEAKDHAAENFIALGEIEVYSMGDLSIGRNYSNKEGQYRKN